MRLFWPARRRTPKGLEPAVSDAEPIHLPVKETPASIAPFPIND